MCICSFTSKPNLTAETPRVAPSQVTFISPGTCVVFTIVISACAAIRVYAMFAFLASIDFTLSFNAHCSEDLLSPCSSTPLCLIPRCRATSIPRTIAKNSTVFWKDESLVSGKGNGSFAQPLNSTGPPATSLVPTPTEIVCSDASYPIHREGSLGT
jgi:hypothetical protein